MTASWIVIAIRNELSESDSFILLTNTSSKQIIAKSSNLPNVEKMISRESVMEEPIISYHHINHFVLGIQGCKTVSTM